MLAKTSSSLFNSTNCDYSLRNLGIEHLVVAGLLTDQCVDHTIRDAADRGYRAICARMPVPPHGGTPRKRALLVRGLLPYLTTDEVIGELRRAPHAGAAQ